MLCFCGQAPHQDKRAKGKDKEEESKAEVDQRDRTPEQTEKKDKEKKEKKEKKNKKEKKEKKKDSKPETAEQKAEREAREADTKLLKDAKKVHGVESPGVCNSSMHVQILFSHGRFQPFPKRVMI